MLDLTDLLPILEICNSLGKPLQDLNLDNGFISNGGDSLRAAALAAGFRRLGLDLPLSKVLTCKSIRQLLSTLTSKIAEPSPVSHNVDIETRVLQGPNSLGINSISDTSHGSSTQGSSRSSSARTSSRSASGQPSPVTAYISSTPPGQPGESNLTDMQLSFIHGTLRHPGANIITHEEIYYSKDIPALKQAWKTVMELEPIFNQDVFRGYGTTSIPQVFNWVENEDYTATRVDSPSSSVLDSTPTFGSFFHVVPVNTESSTRKHSKVTWTVHHALVDGYSASLLFEKVLRLVNGLDARPGPSFSQYVQNLRLYQEAHQASTDLHWARKQKQFELARGDLPFPMLRNPQPGERLTSGKVNADTSRLHQALIFKSAQLGVTPSAFFNAAWAMTLGVYTDSDVVMFSTVLSGRTLPLPRVRDVVGPLVNILPFVVHFCRSNSTQQLIQGIFHDLAELESVQFASSPDVARLGVIESALSVQFNLPESKDWNIRPLGRETQQESEIPLAIVINGDGTMELRYHTCRFTRRDASRIATTFTGALELLLQDKTVDDALKRLHSAASSFATKEFSNCAPTTMIGSIKHDLVTLFETSARGNAQGVAAEKDNSVLTYAEMDAAAGVIAHRLSQYIKPGEVVCVHSDRSLNWLIAIYGLLKAGGVYCSLDPELPHQLRSTIFALSGARCIIVPHEDQLQIPLDSCRLSFSVSNILGAVRASSHEPWPHRSHASPGSPAYVCFTSGSTGTPKGVVCRHESLVAFQSTLEVRLFSQPGKRIAHVMSVAFDGSIHEIFSALSHGATLVLPGSNVAEPFSHLKTADAAILTPSLARVLNPMDFGRLKWVYLVGEPVPQVVNDLWASQKQLYNMYGPTEGTCGATIKRLLPGLPVTIGVPNPTTRVYILTPKGTPAPTGVVGEIYLAGVQIANGYIGLPDQTEERFLKDTVWAKSHGERMYKTGDRGYWNERGEVVCLGRVDRQIKLRGYRLDLNDLEIRIEKAVPQLQGVAVALQGINLVCMVQPEGIDTDDLRLVLSSVLPRYAMPQAIVAVDQLPITSTGKVDYKAVANELHSARLSDPSLPRTPTEKTVAAAFRSVLGLGETVRITTASSFLELGGHSILQLQLLKRLSQDLGTHVSLRAIVQQSTVKDLARFIDKSRQRTKHTVRCEEIGKAPASPIETEWLQKYTVDSGSSSFNVCFTCVFDESKVDRARLVSSWNVVLARFKLLASRYVVDRRKGAFRSQTKCAPRVQCVQSVDLWTEANRPFEVDKSDPVRVFVTSDRLIVVMTHIVADYVAMSMLLGEASRVYKGDTIDLSRAPRDYSDASVWYDTPPPASLDFWSVYLQGYPERQYLFNRALDRTDYSGTSAISVMEKSIMQPVMEYTETSRVTLQQLAVACVAACLEPDLSKTDMLIGIPYMNRETVEDLDTFGLFLEPFPLRIRYDEDSADRTYVQSVVASSQTALSNAIPWHQLLTLLEVKPDYPNHPLLDVMVTVHDYRSCSVTGAGRLQMDAPGFGQSCCVWSEGAKFKLLLEFTILEQGKCILRIEYDSNCVPLEEVRRLQAKIPRALEMMTVGYVTHREMKLKLSRVDATEERGPGWGSVDGTSLFGISIGDI